jgi:hypothetical protein
MVILVSCKEGGNPKFITQINADGTCSKIIETTADSAFIVGDTSKNPFDIDLDSTWEVSWRYKTSEYSTTWPLKSWTWDTTSKEPLNAKAVQNYKSVEDMASSFKLSKKHKWRNIKPTYSFNKKFRWFYTYYTYSELYPKLKTLDRIPFDKYFTRTEAEFWFNGNLDLVKGMNGMEIKDEATKVESKFNQWFFHNVLDEQFDIYVEKFDSIKGLKIDKQKFISKKDSIIQLCLNKIDNDLKDLELDDYLDKFFNTKAFTRYSEENKETLKARENMILGAFIDYFDPSIDYNLLMPGKIMKTENMVNHGDTLSINLTAYRMTYSDFTISATSRKSNTWAFIVTGLIVLLALGSLFVKNKRN